jgi:AhpD family alkylhydroperoxidase
VTSDGSDKRCGKGERIMQARMPNPAIVLPDAMKPIHVLIKAAHGAGVAQSTTERFHLRASQVKGCSACVASGALRAKKVGERRMALLGVRLGGGAFFSASARAGTEERAALAVAEAVTRLNDRGDPVPDEIWDEATRH